MDYVYAHPLEIMIENSGTFVGILLLGHVSFTTIWLFGIIRVIHAVHSHSGVSGMDPLRLMLNRRRLTFQQAHQLQ
jgi:sterol desaturase/sphingolipid hydroxylase (fatty acid hydroxylase superfamily)